MIDLDPVLKRWLKTLGDDPASKVPDLVLWKKFLKRVNGHLSHLQDDRDLLTRSLELSTSEMNELHERIKDQRDALEDVVIAAGDAMGVFREVTMLGPDTTVEDVAESMAIARQKFTVKLTDALADSDDLALGTSSGSIRGLQQSFLVLADQLMELVNGTTEAAALRKQLEVAGAVQQMLMPEVDVLSFPGIDLAAFFQPATSCGGDWWTANQLEDGRLLVVVGDVTGHGVSSAIITGIAKGSCDLARIASRQALRPASLLRMMNRVIYESAKRRYMMTTMGIIIDTAKSELTMCNAGHPPAWLFRKDKCHTLRGQRDPPLGASADHAYKQVRVPIESGDLLFIFTDGVSEFENTKGDQYTEKRVRRFLQTLAKESPEDVRTKLVASLGTFGAGQAQEDDVTFVVLRIT